ncbi:DNA polymerase beta domain protein region [Caldicellulosiruptor acetigenus I77R1B]|uniref:DNA polymerase beta domain protein region n=1 Tax=Caldicellulosiruptor acetigenus (strain ATCC 700853 / DSM 12137 / I77R1B) TaxID=632335 RepID=E4SA62_CALA7|nr:nucleotidyltransferase domain-containing protein [Caldicellulosiruptor acetigenus]ADQ41147.1 DNA polymerase beta domain protein region [Caldicellulosiruptor acetigenus I77R1B]WAM37268.1 nucleotidyltransferase domain-containing protein [Caldicellulosiruptor acetigenus]
MEQKTRFKDIHLRQDLEQITQELKKIYGDKLIKVILFGSYATGKYDLESDVDIAVLVDLDEDQLKKYEDSLDAIATEFGYKTLKVFSIIDFPFRRFEKLKEILPFYKSIEEKGIVLYG